MKNALANVMNEIKQNKIPAGIGFGASNILPGDDPIGQPAGGIGAGIGNAMADMIASKPAGIGQSAPSSNALANILKTPEPEKEKFGIKQGIEAFMRGYNPQAGALIDFNNAQAEQRRRQQQQEQQQAQSRQIMGGLSVLDEMLKVPADQRAGWEASNAGAISRITGQDPTQSPLGVYDDGSLQSLRSQLMMNARALGMDVAEPEAPERQTTTINGRLVDAQTGEEIADYSDAPEPGFRTLTAEEAQQMGLPEGQAYQVGPDNKVYPIRGQSSDPSLNIQFNDQGNLAGLTYGDAPKGKEAAIIQNRQGDPVVSPGPQQLAYNKQVKSLQSIEAQHEVVERAIDEALEGIGAWTAGMGGSMLRGVPGTAAYDLEKTIETIRANVGFDKLSEMRENSPTGGALGNVTEKEIAFLQAVLGSLETGQSPEQLRQTLTEVKQFLTESRERRRQALVQDYPGLADTVQFRQETMKSGGGSVEDDLESLKEFMTPEELALFIDPA